MRRSVTCAAILAAVAGTAAGQLQHGVIQVVENDGGNVPSSITLNRVGGFGPWTTVGANSTRGDYAVDFGILIDDGTGNLVNDDVNQGVLIVGPANDERTEASVTGFVDGVEVQIPYFATTSVERVADGTNGIPGGYFIAVSDSPSGAERNYDVALAYFPLDLGFVVGHGDNQASGNGAPLSEFVGTASLTNPFNPTPPAGPLLIDNANGNFGLVIPGINIARDGVLLASGGKNENNYTALQVRTVDGSAILNNRDNGDNGGGSEQDGTAFAFIPYNTEGLVTGRVSGSGRQFRPSDDYTVALNRDSAGLVIPGEFRLTIFGESASTGTLIATPHSNLEGATVDNPLFVETDGDDWILTTRDIAGMGSQNTNSGNPNFDFVFFPNDTDGNLVPGGPVEVTETVAAARIDIIELSGGNANGEQDVAVTPADGPLNVIGLNRGDVAVSIDGAEFVARIDAGDDITDDAPPTDGLPFVSTLGLNFDNTQTGGVSGFAVSGWDNGEARTHVVATAAASSEINSDFAVAYFPTAAGFQMEGDVMDTSADVGGDGILEVTPDGVTNASQDGVLIAIAWDNNPAFTTVETDSENPDQYIVTVYEAFGDTIGEIDTTVDIGWVYLPYNTTGLVAGQIEIDSEGDAVIVSQSDNGAFTITPGTTADGFFPTWDVEITDDGLPGRNAVDARTDGVLLLNAAQASVAMAWQANELGQFEITGFDTVLGFEGRTAFNFAYIPYSGLELAVDAPCPPDQDLNGVLDIDDFSTFVSNFFAASTIADINGDGSLDIDDFSDFVSQFFNPPASCDVN